MDNMTIASGLNFTCLQEGQVKLKAKNKSLIPAMLSWGTWRKRSCLLSAEKTWEDFQFFPKAFPWFLHRYEWESYLLHGGGQQAGIFPNRRHPILYRVYWNRHILLHPIVQWYSKRVSNSYLFCNPGKVFHSSHLGKWKHCKGLFQNAFDLEDLQCILTMHEARDQAIDVLKENTVLLASAIHSLNHITTSCQHLEKETLFQFFSYIWILFKSLQLTLESQEAKAPAIRTEKG